MYYRFAVALEGELDALDSEGAGASGEGAAALLARLVAEGDFERYEDDVHWEASGVLCRGCRNRLEALLTGATTPPEVH